jgi:GT2 family glycosyltransferase
MNPVTSARRRAIRIPPIPPRTRPPPVTATGRPRIAGKFFTIDKRKFYIKGVTYGPFRPNAEGCEYHDPARVERDFAAMAQDGLNTVRVYTLPPRWLLDAAQRHGLRVMVGVAWEQHIAFLDEPARSRDIERRVREAVRACAGHPAILCYVIGNEIPAPIVRGCGARRVSRFLKRLYRAAKAEDPNGLVTYVNYPSTEYLQLPFVDFVCFNVYLESPERLAAYLARLQNLAGERPLVMAEIGLDSRRNGEETQARTMDWQVRTTFAGGCAGVFVFSWTDEWFRGGYDIEDWDFGLTRREGTGKPALAAVRHAFHEAPFARDRLWPRITVAVCSYNGGRTIRDACEGLIRLDYPDHEVIVVSDGSTDATPAIAQEYGFRVIHTPNRGLSSARNTALEAATGEIIAYLDDDARPDPHWLQYLAAKFMESPHVGVGGPNLAPPGDGAIADCVANSPGGPVHVLVSDEEAEHIPGCNMAYRTAALKAVGGFDPRYWTAGDDVDICWRLQARGWTIGFSHGAMVWHHRRNSIRMYWKQQRGYGKAEALLEEKWPEKYNRPGHVTWRGRLYGKGLTRALAIRRSRIYHGRWGSALFQSIYEVAPGTLSCLPLMPEWYLGILGLGFLTAVGAVWTPLWFVAAPLLAFALGALLLQAALSAAQASFTSKSQTRSKRVKLYALTTCMHLMQPLARLWGRLSHGLTPWRRRGPRALAWPWPGTASCWSEQWVAPSQWLERLEERLRAQQAVVLRGGDYDAWDLLVRGGFLGGTRIQVTVEEHGAGRQMIRWRYWPKACKSASWVTLGCALLAVAAAWQGALLALAVLGVTALGLIIGMLQECAATTRTILNAVRDPLCTKMLSCGGSPSTCQSPSPQCSSNGHGSA